jgi:cellulose synthase/poly-beta-1,6-N-acetylglucosamine synthase-like glycosyltransferase
MISVVIISKDERGIDTTLADVAGQCTGLGEDSEIVVVDASAGRLDDIWSRHKDKVRWIDFAQPDGVAVSIPHQRNLGVRTALGDIIVFTDAGCRPDPGWLPAIVAPVRSGQEDVASGLTLALQGSSTVYDRDARASLRARYLSEVGAGNLAFRRDAFDAVGGFDETFAYGSDIDFTWRLNGAGYRIASVPEAVNRHDWGSRRRRLRRSYVYGKARVRLYRKHRLSLMEIARRDPMAVTYPVFLLGLPLTLLFPVYPALLLIPAWRNRSNGPVRVVMHHLAYGSGILVELLGR